MTYLSDGNRSYRVARSTLVLSTLVMFGECLVIPALHQSLGSGFKGGFNYFMNHGAQDDNQQSPKWKRALPSFSGSLEYVNPDYVNW